MPDPPLAAPSADPWKDVKAFEADEAADMAELVYYARDVDQARAEVEGEIDRLRAELETEKANGLRWYTSVERYEDLESTLSGGHDEWNHPKQTFEEMITSLKAENVRLTQERDAAMKVLAPSVPESGLEDAARQVKQAAMSWRENYETLEAASTALQGQIQAVIEQWRSREVEAAESVPEAEQRQALIAATGFRARADVYQRCAAELAILCGAR